MPVGSPQFRPSSIIRSPWTVHTEAMGGAVGCERGREPSRKAQEKKKKKAEAPASIKSLGRPVTLDTTEHGIGTPGIVKRMGPIALNRFGRSVCHRLCAALLTMSMAVGAQAAEP